MSKKRKNIYQRKDGRWEGRYIKSRNNGQSKYGYVFGKTYEEAEGKLDAALIQIQEDHSCSGSFESVAKDWLEAQKPELKVSSISKYNNILNTYLIPQYGPQSIVDVTRGEVSAFSKELLITGGAKGSGLAPKTVNSILSVLKNIFAYAEREMSINTSDINDISVKQPQKPMRILSLDEQQRLSRYLQENISTCLLGILLCLYTGLRIGEICALRWKDIFIRDQYLYVRQTMQRVQIEGGETKTKVMIQSPKSDCSIRKIPFPDEMLSLMLPYQAQEEAFLLTGMVHSFIEPRNLENHFKAATKECDIYDVNFHALRHTFATRCIELGFDIKSLSEILGHASVNITLNRYVHPSMELKQKNMNKLSGLLTTK